MQRYYIYFPDVDEPEEVWAESPEEAVQEVAEKDGTKESYQVQVVDSYLGGVWTYEVEYIPEHFNVKPA